MLYLFLDSYLEKPVWVDGSPSVVWVELVCFYMEPVSYTLCKLFVNQSEGGNIFIVQSQKVTLGWTYFYPIFMSRLVEHIFIPSRSSSSCLGGYVGDVCRGGGRGSHYYLLYIGWNLPEQLLPTHLLSYTRFSAPCHRLIYLWIIPISSGSAEWQHIGVVNYIS